MSKVAVVRARYLPLSETFVYEELVHLRSFFPILCAKQLLNLQRFPFEPIFQYQKAEELRDVLRQQRVRLIHARFGRTGAELLDVKNAEQLPLLTSFHGHDLPTNQKIWRKREALLQRLFQEGEAFTATSQYMKKILVAYGCPAEKIYVHYSGIDVERFAYRKRCMPQKSPVILLSVGRLVEKKGMADLLEAFFRVQKKFPRIELRIAGDGPLLKPLQRRAKQLRLADHVVFLGALTHGQVAREMRRAHLFALASHTTRNGDQEGIPNVLKEAMASGLPVVSTRHAGIPELVQDGKEGFLVAERDPRALAGRILELVEQPKLWNKMGRKGRKKVLEFFHLQTQVRELENIYTRMIRKN